MPEMPVEVKQVYEIAFQDAGEWIEVVLSNVQLIHLLNTRQLGGVEVVAITLRKGLIYDFPTKVWRAHSCRDKDLLWPKFD